MFVLSGFGVLEDNAINYRFRYEQPTMAPAFSNRVDRAFWLSCFKCFVRKHVIIAHDEYFIHHS